MIPDTLNKHSHSSPDRAKRFHVAGVMEISPHACKVMCIQSRLPITIFCFCNLLWDKLWRIATGASSFDGSRGMEYNNRWWGKVQRHWLWQERDVQYYGVVTFRPQALKKEGPRTCKINWIGENQRVLIHTPEEGTGWSNGKESWCQHNRDKQLSLM